MLLSYLLVALLAISIVVVYSILRRLPPPLEEPPPPPPPSSWDFEAPPVEEPARAKKQVSLSLISTVRVVTPTNISDHDVSTIAPHTRTIVGNKL